MSPEKILVSPEKTLGVGVSLGVPAFVAEAEVVCREGFGGSRHMLPTTGPALASFGRGVLSLGGALCGREPVSAMQAPRRVIWDRAAFEALLREGGYEKALELVRRMRKRWPEEPSLAHALVLLESHVEGGDESHAALLFEEACQAFLRGDKEVAKRMFLTCRRMQPKAWLVRFNLGRLGGE